MKDKTQKTPDMERYEVDQIYALRSGEYALITDVDPFTKLRNNDTTRRCTIRIGKIRRKGDEFSTDLALVVEDNTSGLSIIFDMSKYKNIPISDLKCTEIYYVGKLTGDKVNQKNRLISDNAGKMGW